MPYQQRTPRHLGGHIISYGDVCLAHTRVCAELVRLGFWSERLEGVQVWWVSASLQCYGWYQGDIHIPAVSGAQLSDLVMGRKTRLTDVLRHEWAHAIADHWPELVDSRRFYEAFGGSYESTGRVGDFHPDAHLTLYAATSACEDFAEVFHFYLRHNGRLPVRLQSKPRIMRKWEFIRCMAARISGGH